MDSNMAAEGLSSILIDLQKHLKTANVKVSNLSTIAQKGDDKLVEKFLGESTFVKNGDSSLDLATSSQKVVASQFYIACFWGFRDIVKRIIDVTDDSEIAFNINAQNDETSWTPLHAATFQEHGPIIMLLLDKGGNPEKRDSEGRTPIDFASASDKIWGHFAAQGYRKTPKGELVEMGIIKKLDTSNGEMGVSTTSPREPAREPGKGIRMAAYSRPESANTMNNDPFNQALTGGDVLAADADEQRQTTTPQFVVYK